MRIELRILLQETSQILIAKNLTEGKFFKCIQELIPLWDETPNLNHTEFRNAKKLISSLIKPKNKVEGAEEKPAKIMDKVMKKF